LLIGVLLVLAAFPSAVSRIAGQQPSAPPAAQAPPTQAAPTQAPPTQTPQAPPAAPTTVPPGQVPPLTFETGVELVSVDVSVVDKEGRPVRGLTKDDFELEVDGAPRVLASSLFVEQSSKSGPEVTEQFSTNEGATGGRLIMIAIDQGNIRQRSNTSFIRTAQRVLDDVGPGDRVALAVIPGGTVIDFTPHIASVRAALLRSTGTSPGQITGRAFIQVSVSEAMTYDAGNVAVLNEIVERECVGISRPTEALPSPTAQCRADIQVE
jgi:hypothetical protein